MLIWSMSFSSWTGDSSMELGKGSMMGVVQINREAGTI